MYYMGAVTGCSGSLNLICVGGKRMGGEELPFLTLLESAGKYLTITMSTSTSDFGLIWIFKLRTFRTESVKSVVVLKQFDNA